MFLFAGQKAAVFPRGGTHFRGRHSPGRACGTSVRGQSRPAAHSPPAAGRIRLREGKRRALTRKNDPAQTETYREKNPRAGRPRKKEPAGTPGEPLPGRPPPCRKRRKGESRRPAGRGLKRRRAARGSLRSGRPRLPCRESRTVAGKACRVSGKRAIMGGADALRLRLPARDCPREAGRASRAGHQRALRRDPGFRPGVRTHSGKGRSLSPAHRKSPLSGQRVPRRMICIRRQP